MKRNEEKTLKSRFEIFAFQTFRHSDRPRDRPSYRDARTHLKIRFKPDPNQTQTRLKPDSNQTQTRLKPDTNQTQTRLKPDLNQT